MYKHDLLQDAVEDIALFVINLHITLFRFIEWYQYLVLCQIQFFGLLKIPLLVANVLLFCNIFDRQRDFSLDICVLNCSDFSIQENFVTIRRGIQKICYVTFQ